jgi:2-oxoglutarate dehydrogenase E1 component
MWCQEEVSASIFLGVIPSVFLTIAFYNQPLNNGAWTYVQPRLITALQETEHHTGKVPTYAGRNPTSSVATGSKAVHKAEVELINNMAFAE